jgi:hypothetical protein
MKRLLIVGVTAAAILFSFTAHHGAAAGALLQLEISPTICVAPGSVTIRAIVQSDAHNRELAIVADSAAFYYRSVIELDGEQARKVHELRLIAIPGGDYEITATLSGSQGVRAEVKRTLMVSQ